MLRRKKEIPTPTTLNDCYLPVVEVKQEPTPRWMDLEGQVLMCLVIILLVANVINQVVKLCF